MEPDRPDEESTRPVSVPKGNNMQDRDRNKEQRDPSELTFLEAKKERDRLYAKHERGEQLSNEERRRGRGLENRMEGLVREAEDSGLLDDVNDDLELFGHRLTNLQEMEQSGELRYGHVEAYLKDVQDARRGAVGFTQTEPDGDYKGIHEYVYVQGLGETSRRARNLQVGNINIHPQQQGVQGGLDERAMARAVAEGVHGGDLTSEKRNIDMLNDEEWNNRPLPDGEQIKPPYWGEMTDREREEYKFRAELSKIANWKRSKMGGLGGPNLDNLSKYPEWNGFTKSETQALYEIPGVRTALEIYIDLADNDTPINGISIRDAKSREQLNAIRRHVRDRIRGDVVNGWRFRFDQLGSEEERRSYQKRGLDFELDGNRYEQIRSDKAREAEQIAFNLLYSGNTFETLDARWIEDERRDRVPKISSDLVHPVIKDAMRPMDALIGSLTKGPEALNAVGKFGVWAYNQILAANGNRPLDKKDNNGNDIQWNVVIVPETKGSQKRFWTVDNRTRTIYAPECYPSELLGSVWEETTVQDGIGGNKTLLDYLRRGQEIEWDKVSGQNMWGAYSSKLSKAGAVWDFLQGKSMIKWREYENVAGWVNDVNNALSKFGRRNESSIKRWILYASAGVDEKKREPHVRTRSVRLDIIHDLGPSYANYLPGEDALFPWD